MHREKESELPFMKTKTWILVLSALLILCLGLSIPMLLPSEAADRAEILSDGKVLHTVDLHTDREIRIDSPTGGHNIVTVKDGAIAVTEATCPDHYCMHRGFCTGGTQIVCLPNRLVISFLDEAEVDFVAG